MFAYVTLTKFDYMDKIETSTAGDETKSKLASYQI